MQTLRSINGILLHVEYKEWSFVVEERSDCFTLQIVFEDVCTVTGSKEIQKCRKWFLSKHMTDNEIIRTAFMAVEKAEYHELCEKFKFRGKLIANPHLDVVKLSEGIADYNQLDHRK